MPAAGIPAGWARWKAGRFERKPRFQGGEFLLIALVKIDPQIEIRRIGAELGRQSQIGPRPALDPLLLLPIIGASTEHLSKGCAQL